MIPPLQCPACSAIDTLFPLTDRLMLRQTQHWVYRFWVCMQCQSQCGSARGMDETRYHPTDDEIEHVKALRQ